jgi:pimeloyl-ACP methyl ester carboxylesterase
LALVLSSDRERLVLALDYRGRGKSDYDRNPANYNLHVELADLLAVLTALGIGRAAFVGTSRGGILTMLLAVARPTAIAGSVLNDIGPVIEPGGLMRIKSYVGKLPQPASFREAADILQRLFGSHFPKWGDADWLAFARRTFKESALRRITTRGLQRRSRPSRSIGRCRHCGRNSMPLLGCPSWWCAAPGPTFYPSQPSQLCVSAATASTSSRWRTRVMPQCLPNPEPPVESPSSSHRVDSAPRH